MFPISALLAVAMYAGAPPVKSVPSWEVGTEVRQ